MTNKEIIYFKIIVAEGDTKLGFGHWDLGFNSSFWFHHSDL